MAKKKKGSAKSRVARPKKTATRKKPAKKSVVLKRKTAANKPRTTQKAGFQSKSGSAAARHLVKPSDEEITKPKVIAKQAVPLEPKDEELDEEVGEEELEMSGEEEIEDEMEEELSLDDEDEDVDYLEKSEDLLDDSDDYRTH